MSGHDESETKHLLGAVCRVRDTIADLIDDGVCAECLAINLVGLATMILEDEVPDVAEQLKCILDCTAHYRDGGAPSGAAEH